MVPIVAPKKRRLKRDEWLEQGQHHDCSDCRPEEEGTETEPARTPPPRLRSVPIVAPKKRGLKRSEIPIRGAEESGEFCSSQKRRGEGNETHANPRIRTFPFRFSDK